MKFRLSYCLIFILLFSSFVSGLAITGKKGVYYIDFEPGLVHQQTFRVSSAEDYAAYYNVITDHFSGSDLSPYFTITPDKIENFNQGDTVEIKVRLELPDSLDTPGESETRVVVRPDFSSSGVIRAAPAVGIRYVVFMLYPTKYYEWSFSASDMNVNETRDFSVNVENLGEPTIGSAKAEIEVISLETDEVVKNLDTQTELDISSRASRSLRASFNSVNLKPGNYKAIATLYVDSNVSVDEREFRIGSQDVKILSFTDIFEYNSINKMDILVESAWNTEIKDIYATVSIHDLDTNEKLAEFTSLNTLLKPWQRRIMEAYFDTSKLEKGDYKAVIVVHYDGVTSKKQGTITIDENVKDVKTLEEMPGKFKLKDHLTTVNILITLLVVFVIINIVLFLGYFRKKKPSEKKSSIDPAVLDHVRELKKKYNDDYIKELMTKKGWAEKKIEEILKEVKN